MLVVPEIHDAPVLVGQHAFTLRLVLPCNSDGNNEKSGLSVRKTLSGLWVKTTREQKGLCWGADFPPAEHT